MATPSLGIESRVGGFFGASGLIPVEGEPPPRVRRAAKLIRVAYLLVAVYIPLDAGEPCIREQVRGFYIGMNVLAAIAVPVPTRSCGTHQCIGRRVAQDRLEARAPFGGSSQLSKKARSAASEIQLRAPTRGPPEPLVRSGIPPRSPRIGAIRCLRIVSHRQAPADHPPPRGHDDGIPCDIARLHSRKKARGVCPLPAAATTMPGTPAFAAARISDPSESKTAAMSGIGKAAYW